MFRQQCLDPVKQLRPGQQIEHRIRIRVARVMAHTLLLPAHRAMARMHGGWLLGWLLLFRNFQPTIRDSQPSRFSFCINRLGLIQRHSGQTTVFNCGNRLGPREGPFALFVRRCPEHYLIHVFVLIKSW